MTAREFEKTMVAMGYEANRSGEVALGEKLGVSRLTVWRWHTGKSDVTILAELGLEALRARARKTRKSTRSGRRGMIRS